MADRRIYTSDDIDSGFLKYMVSKHVSSPFTGGTPNSHGDYDGTGNPYTIFNVTGIVVVAGFWGICNVSLSAGARLKCNVTGSTQLITQYNDTNYINQYTTVTATDETDAGAALGVTFGYNSIIINGDGTSIIETIDVANVTAGQIDYYCVWAAATPGARVVSA